MFETKRRMICFALIGGMLALSGCGESSTGTESSTPAMQVEQRADHAMFEQYTSNTWIATGNNQVVNAADTVTYRAYFPVEATGSHEYCFYFSNTVDSTYADGSKAYVGMPGSAYTIESATVGVTTDNGETLSADNPTVFQFEQAVTFDGQATKSVAPSETFWSDPITLDVPEGYSLVWTWTVTGETIPAIEMSGLTPSYAMQGKADQTPAKFVYTNQIPLPQMIGCDKETKLDIVTLGDSITQGVQTTQYADAFWVAQIAQKLGAEYSLWNLGLGYARASDCALNGDWLKRAAEADVVLVAFGTNDMVSGQYGVGSPNTASSIAAWIRTIVTELQAHGCRVILFNAPPFDFGEVQEGIRTELNTLLPKTAEELGVPFFDFAALLSDPENAAHAIYGGHPNDTGCALIAEQFLEQHRAFLDGIQ